MPKCLAYHRDSKHINSLSLCFCLDFINMWLESQCDVGEIKVSQTSLDLTLIQA